MSTLLVAHRIAVPSLLIPGKGTGKHQPQPGQESKKECSSIIAYLFANISLTKMNQ
jgi:hypothetical protein